MHAAALYRSSIGKKAIMAVTGMVWIGFVAFHMYGNLKAFQGAEYFNGYAEGLRELGAPVFGHLHLLTLLRIAIVAAIALTLRRRKDSKYLDPAEQVKVKRNDRLRIVKMSAVKKPGTEGGEGA